MKRILLLLCMLLGLSSALFSQENDQQMLNAQLRFISEKAKLTKKEYQKFAKIYLEYNQQLMQLNREQYPEGTPMNMFSMPMGRADFGRNSYSEKWNKINSEYRSKLEKALPDSTISKIGMAQFELGQKIWKQWADENMKIQEQQIEFWRDMEMHSVPNQMGEIFFRNHENWREVSRQQEEWWKKYWQNWDAPDSFMMRRDSLFNHMQGGHMFMPGNPGQRMNPGQYNPGQYNPGQFSAPGQYMGPMGNGMFPPRNINPYQRRSERNDSTTVPTWRSMPNTRPDFMNQYRGYPQRRR